MSSAITATVVSIGTSLYSASKQSDAAEKAAETQATAATEAAQLEYQATQDAIASQEKMLAQTQELLQPWVTSGTTALSQQLALSGASGEAAQATAIEGIKSGAEYSALMASGQEQILQSASATGGLRGGNVESALAEYGTTVLSELIEQQYSRLSGISSTGENAAAGVGTATQQTSSNVANLLQSGGQSLSSGTTAAAAATSAGAQAQSNISSALWGDIGAATGEVISEIASKF